MKARLLATHLAVAALGIRAERHYGAPQDNGRGILGSAGATDRSTCRAERRIR